MDAAEPVRSGDHVDRVIEQWRAARPDLELAPMATFGRLGRVYAHATRAIEAMFRRHGLTIGEFDVLAALRRAGDPHEMTPTDLARLLMVSPAGMTNRIDRLEAAGLVRRRPDPDDRRSSFIILTRNGRTLVDDAVTDHLANEADLLSGLTDTERRSFDRLLRRLLAHLEPAEGPS
jgi:DNA-binding MarR family transcriptional regulator